MAALFCVCAIVLLLVCAILFFTPWRKTGGWLLTLFPIALCIGILVDLAKGEKGLGASSYNTDLKTLFYLLVLLGVTVRAALRPRWIWPFWIVWLFNALCCSIAVYLTFFWKVFS